MVWGVLNVRGSLLGVVHLAAFLEADSGQITPPVTGVVPNASVVTLNELLEVNSALQVDSLAGLRSSDAFKAAERPDPEAPSYFGNLFTDVDGTQ